MLRFQARVICVFTPKIGDDIFNGIKIYIKKIVEFVVVTAKSAKFTDWYIIVNI
jgi:hypothetical protein